MIKWKTGALREACNISTGFAFKGDQYESSGNLRVVRGENVTVGTLRWDSEKHWNHSLAGLDNYFLAANDIVIGMDGSRVGQNRAKVRAVDLPLILAQRVARLRAKEGFNQDFIWYQIIDDRFKDYVEAIHTGTSIPHISMNQIGDYEVTLPPLSEQKAIASVLSSLDDKIDLLHRQNKTLEAMAETLFRQWFVEELEEDSNTIFLGDIAYFSNGKSRPEEVPNGSVPIYGGNGILGYTNQSNSNGFSIIIGRVGAYCGSLFIENKPIWISDNAMLAKPINDSSHSYLFYLLRNLRLNEFAEGSSHPLLTQTLLNSIQIISPSAEKISLFCHETDKWKEKSDFNQLQIETLETLRDTLLPKLMSGEVRVDP